MIPKEYRQLQELMLAFVQKKQPEFQEEPNWDSLIQLSRMHSISGITAYMISRYSLAADETVNAAAKTMAKQTVFWYVHRGEKTAKLLKELNARGIEHGMLKGYVLRNCYPVPELRSYGDMDLVIHANDRKKVHQMMTDMGFQTKTSWEPVYSYFRNDELYEFHTEIMEVDVSDKADYRGYFRSVWDHMVPEQDHTFVPDPEFHFLYLICHIAKHIAGSGAGLRMYLDIAFYLKTFGSSMDWEWIREELAALRLSDFANTVLTAVEQWFGVQSPLLLKPVSEEILEDFFVFTLEGGTFGHAGRDSGYTCVQIFSYECKMPAGRSFSMSPPSYGRVKCLLMVIKCYFMIFSMRSSLPSTGAGFMPSSLQSMGYRSMLRKADFSPSVKGAS